MFYSQCLLSRKGHLGTIWVAAHCLKRLKKDQVAQINISSSVDKILVDEVPVVAYRVLGFLLLGVVRIYSKKVEYLFHDCRKVLVKVNGFAGRKSANMHIEAMCAPYLSITRPERFELDAFDLQILEDGSRVNVSPVEDIMLKDGWRNEGTGHNSFDKYHCEEDAAYFETCYTPVKDVLSPYIMKNDVMAGPSHNLRKSEASIEKRRRNIFSLEECLDPIPLSEVEEEPGLVRPLGPSHNLRKSEASIEKRRGNIFSLEERLDPMQLGEVEEELGLVRPLGPSHNLRKSEASKEKLRGNIFSLEERLDPMPLSEVEEEPGLVRPLGEKYQIDGEQLKFPNTENEPPDPIRSVDEEQHMNAEQIKLPEMISPESRKCQIYREDRPESMTIDVTPQSKCPNASGATTPEFIAVRTPAAKEHARVSRKRKCLFDDIIVLPNKVLKESIDDSSNLVCKRKKAPHTNLYGWKAFQISNLPHTFLEPLFPCISLELRSLFCRKKLKRPEAVETVEASEKIDILSPEAVETVEASEKIDILSPEAVETVEAPEKLDILGSPNVHRSPDETDIAPPTPVARPTSSRLHEALEITKSDRVGPSTSFESIEKELSEDKQFDISLLNEEINSREGDNQETNEWSVRTRTLARYLHRSFLHRKKRREDKVVTLSQFLKRRTNSESARVFYEILVLKTGGYIDVKQEAAYDDILVLETPKLKQSCEAADEVNAS